MDFCPGELGMRVRFTSLLLQQRDTDICCRIVEYATRDQAQNAVNTLSNQNLMGRLVYVREVRSLACITCAKTALPRLL